MTTVLAPNSDLVATTWLRSIVGITNVGTVLPENASTWASDGFVQVTTVGGTPTLDVPIRNPLIQLDFWASNPNSSKAPMGHAATMAQTVLEASYDLAFQNLILELASPFGAARIFTARCVMEPRPVFPTASDPNYGRYSADFILSWVRA